MDELITWKLQPTTLSYQLTKCYYVGKVEKWQSYINDILLWHYMFDTFLTCQISLIIYVLNFSFSRLKTKNCPKVFVPKSMSICISHIMTIFSFKIIKKCFEELQLKWLIYFLFTSNTMRITLSFISRRHWLWFFHGK